MKISAAKAAEVLRAAAADTSAPDPAWTAKVERLSQLCEEGIARTHIAFLGTSMLAKAVDRRADLFIIKPKHAADNENAYSARSLSEKVLVPLAAELGINIGVTGRQPLNNQPYFRMTHLGDNTPVHEGGRAAFTYMVELVRELQELRTEAEAARALHAFVVVRRRYQPRYLAQAGEIDITPEAFTRAVERFVAQNSEGGRRAQAVVAGLLDVFAGVERVESGRINDPSRKYPGDVCVRSAADPDQWDKAIEVRDKPVSLADVQIFGTKCVAMNVREAAVVMVADRQQVIDAREVAAWAADRGIGMTLFQGWPSIVDQALFWADLPKPEGVRKAAAFIHERLIAVEASPEAVNTWANILKTRTNNAP